MNLVIHDIFFREGFGKYKNLLSCIWAQEFETEHEMDSCQQFRNLMLNIKLMDKELALVCAENLSE